MHTTDKPPHRFKRPTAFLIGNLLIAIFMLVAIPIVRSGQSDFANYATLDKTYVRSVLADGRTESLQNALKDTEVARALGHKEHVATLGLIQVAAVLLAGLFLMNTFMLYGMSRPQPVPVRVNPR